MSHHPPCPPRSSTAALDLIAAEQASLARGTTMLGETREGIAAELGRPCRPTGGRHVRVVEDGQTSSEPPPARVRRGHGPRLGVRPVGAPATTRPGTVGPDRSSTRRSSSCLPGIDRVGAGRRCDQREDGCARPDSLGWEPSEVSHVLLRRRPTAAGSWADPVNEIRVATAADREAIRPLHDQEFPATYAPVECCCPTSRTGSSTSWSPTATPAAGSSGTPRAGPARRRRVPRLPRRRRRRPGQGRRPRPAVAIGRSAGGERPHHDVRLTVQDHRAPARRLYESLGFTLQLSMVGYSTEPTFGRDGPGRRAGSGGGELLRRRRPRARAARRGRRPWAGGGGRRHR